MTRTGTRTGTVAATGAGALSLTGVVKAFGAVRAVAGGGADGSGLKGLAERLAAAGGALEAGVGARGGFVVTAELPVLEAEVATA